LNFFETYGSLWSKGKMTQTSITANNHIIQNPLIIKLPDRFDQISELNHRKEASARKIIYILIHPIPQLPLQVKSPQ
jgi:hypothetical protein